jgi:5-methylcytosine-specific restriction endonuclease McrA
MRDPNRKKGRRRLEPDSYRELHRQVLKRDGWTCQMCGRIQNLQVHHLQFRSRLGADNERNLITLCLGCHNDLHKTKIGH